MGSSKLMVRKRSGRIVPYNTKKIYCAIQGANTDSHEMTTAEINWMVLHIDSILSQSEESLTVEGIQDLVEDTLMKHEFRKTAREYIRYRHLHEIRRNATRKLMESYDDLLFADAKDVDLKRDNANVNTDAPMGIMLKVGAEGMKTYAKYFALPEEYAQMHIDNIVHIHDLDFSYITMNCIQIDLLKLFKNGFSTGHGFLREPNSIRSAASLACIAIQANQNDQFGGQSINAIDYALAPYVKKSFTKAYKKNIENLMALYCDSQETLDALRSIEFDVAYGYCGSDNIEKELKKWASQHDDVNLEECVPLRRIAVTAWENACRDVKDETKQAMEALIHNLNTLHSRAGAQTPFSSLNYGMDTSLEGRLVIDKLLDAIWNGLGHGETPIFPISVFQLKAGVNYNPGDPNYDLFKKACKVSAKRLFPKQNWGLSSCIAA